MQVDVHRVDAEVARPRLAHHRVEVGSVAVEIGARRVHGVGDFHDIALEQAAGVGVGQHDRGNVGRERRLDRFGADDAVGLGRHSAHRQADQRRGGGIGAVGGIGNEDDGARLVLAARRKRRLDRHHAAELAVRTRLRRHRHRAHASQREQRLGQRVDQLERALHGRDRLQRMEIGEARQARHLLVEPRIVLHRARTERIEPGVDRVIVARQAHVMAHRFGLGQARQADRRAARMRPELRGERRRRFEIDAGRVEAAGLEDQRLFHVERAIAGERAAARRLAAARAGGAALVVHRLPPVCSNCASVSA